MMNKHFPFAQIIFTLLFIGLGLLVWNMGTLMAGDLTFNIVAEVMHVCLWAAAWFALERERANMEEE